MASSQITDLNSILSNALSNYALKSSVSNSTISTIKNDFRTDYAGN